jgi:hypothetical protein
VEEAELLHEVFLPPSMVFLHPSVPFGFLEEWVLHLVVISLQGVRSLAYDAP